MFFYIMMALLESLFIIILFGDFFEVGELISVSFVFSNNIWVVCSQLLSAEGIFFAMEVKMPLVSHGLLKERCSFLDA